MEIIYYYNDHEILMDENDKLIYHLIYYKLIYYNMIYHVNYHINLIYIIL